MLHSAESSVRLRRPRRRRLGTARRDGCAAGAAPETLPGVQGGEAGESQGNPFSNGSIPAPAERWQILAGSFPLQAGFSGEWTIVQDFLQCKPQAGLHARVLRGHGGCALFPLTAGFSHAAAPAILCASARFPAAKAGAYAAHAHGATAGANGPPAAKVQWWLCDGSPTPKAASECCRYCTVAARLLHTQLMCFLCYCAGLY